MPSDYARQLVSSLISFCAITARDDEQLSLAAAIDASLRLLKLVSGHAGDVRDDFASLLFIECGETKGELTAQDLQRLINRVEKRLYRELTKSRPDPTKLRQADQAGFWLHPAAVERIKVQFKQFVRERLSVTDSAILQMHYFEGVPAKQIASDLDLSVSSVYERIHRLRKQFEKFLDDVVIPNIKQ